MNNQQAEVNSNQPILDSIRQIRDELASMASTRLWESPHVWLSAKEMADLLGMESRTLCEKAAEGFLPGHKPPGCKAWVFNPREVSEAIRNQGAESLGVVRTRAKSHAEKILAKHRARQAQRTA